MKNIKKGKASKNAMPLITGITTTLKGQSRRAFIRAEAKRMQRKNP